MDLDALADAVGAGRGAGAVRAGHGRVAAGAVVGPGRLEGDHPRRRVGAAGGSAGRAPSRRSCARRWRRWPTGGPGCCSSAQPDELGRGLADGMVTVPMACESDGAMEVYVEPFLPTAAGRGHRAVSGGLHPGRAGARARLGRRRGRRRWRPGRPPPPRARAHDASTSTASGSGRRRRSSSPRRATTTTSPSRPRSPPTPATSGWSRRRSGRRRPSSCSAGAASARSSCAVSSAPAGPRPRVRRERRDRRRRAGRPRRPPGRRPARRPRRPPASGPPSTTVDPVCGMTVDRAHEPLPLDGRRRADVWFCGAGCKAAFDADPGAYGS